MAHNGIGQERKRQTSQAEVASEPQHWALLLLKFSRCSAFCHWEETSQGSQTLCINLFCVFSRWLMLPKMNRNTKLHCNFSDSDFPGRSLINFIRIHCLCLVYFKNSMHNFARLKKYKKFVKSQYFLCMFYYWQKLLLFCCFGFFPLLIYLTNETAILNKAKNGMLQCRA